VEEVVIIRYSEIAVKGRRTRHKMERLLARNVGELLAQEGLSGRVVVEDGRIIIYEPRPDALTVSKEVTRIFGVKSASPSHLLKFRGLDDLLKNALDYFKERVSGRIFAVRARRTGSHSFTSKDVERLLGELLLKHGGKGVDLENPEYVAHVEIRGEKAFLYDKVFPGPGGLPLGSEDPVVVLFSGGFDSTVASWLLMKRGSPISLITFYFGLREPLEIIVEAANFLKNFWSYGSEIHLYLVNFEEIAALVRDYIEKDYRVLVLRRLMAKYSESLALSEGFKALATGESIGQVASQTVNNLMLIWREVSIPVLRPVITMDKDEIVKLAREIGVYDIVSRQVETCKRLGSPNPRAPLKAFEKRFKDFQRILDERVKMPAPVKFKAGNINVSEAIRQLEQ